MLHIEETGRRFAPEVSDPIERAERAEAAEHRERQLRIEAEATAAELAELLAAELAARRRAEHAHDRLAALLSAERRLIS
jgi:hypothetical protein